MDESSDPTPGEPQQFGTYPLVDRRRRSTDAPGPEQPTQFGPYRLIRPIGQGGMATVFEGMDARMDRRVAIKMMSPAPSSFGSGGFGEDPAAMVMRIQQEARLLANLTHPNVVMIYDVGQHEGRPYLVMEYVDGVNLQQYLKDRGAPLSLAETADILDQIASGLDALHSAGIVHRDLKSANLMLVATGGVPRVKLLDLGIARPAEDTTLTSTGMIMGSPSYVAPEILQGQKATVASDMWSLGIVLYEMLSGGNLPFPGEQLTAVLYRIAHTPPAPLPNLPPAVETVLNTALSKDPAARPASASALAHAFRAAATGSGSGIGRLAGPRRSPALVPALAVAALALVGVAGWALWPKHSPPSPITGEGSPTPVASATPVAVATPAPSVAATPTVAPVATPKPAASASVVVVQATPSPTPSPTPPPVKVIPAPGDGQRIKKTSANPKKSSPSKGTGGAKTTGTQKPLVIKKHDGPLPPLIGPGSESGGKKQASPPPVDPGAPASMGDDGTAVPDLPSLSPSPTAEKRRSPRGPNVGDALPDYRTDPSVEGVRTAIDAWLDATMFGDLDMLLSLYARRLEQYGPAGIDIPRAAVRADKKRLFADVRPLSINLDDPRIELSRDQTRATVRFRTTSVWPRAAGNRPSRVRHELIWVFTDAGWKIVSERTLR